MVVLLCGDSITMGFNDPGGGWAAKLRSYWESTTDSFNNHDIEIYNLGISGDNSNDLLKRLKQEIISRYESGEDLVIVFAIGTNDSQWLISKKRNNVSFDQFLKNLDSLTKIARRYTQEIYFLGLTPVDEPLVTPLPWNTDKSYKNEFVKKYDSGIKTFCQKEKLNFIDIYLNWSKDKYKDWLDDGLHPNEQGHQKIFESVKNNLKL